MNRFGTAAVAALLFGLSARAQDNGYWKAASTTARSITGDIGISGERLSINFATFTIADIRPLTADESVALFNIEADTKGGGKLYRLNIPAQKAFLHRNNMCGAEDTQWMTTFVSAKTMQVAFFSGSRMPAFTPDAIANSSVLCGTFLYTR